MSAPCHDCHLKPIGPAAHIAGQARATLAANALADECLTLPAPLGHLRVDLTTRCNLRCVYCAVSQPWYVGEDLPSSSFDEIVGLVESQKEPLEIAINGHGETTYHPLWLELASRLIGEKRHISIISNFAKPFSDEEVSCLSHFTWIQVSLDTVDPILLARLRRKVKLETIIDNISRVRRVAAQEGRPAPQFALSCGVFDLSTSGLPALANFAAAQKMAKVTFWQLVKYEDLPGQLNPKPIWSLAREQIVFAIEQLQTALNVLTSCGIQTELAGGFLGQWRQLAQADAPDSSPPKRP